MVETFGDVVIRILYTIINSAIDTTVAVISDVFLLFRTINNNLGSLSPLSIIIAIAIMGLIAFGVFKLVKGEMKPLLIAVAILIVVLMVALLI